MGFLVETMYQKLNCGSFFNVIYCIPNQHFHIQMSCFHWLPNVLPYAYVDGILGLIDYHLISYSVVYYFFTCMILTITSKITSGTRVMVILLILIISILTTT